MKLLTFTLKKEQNLRVGALKNENIVDLSEAELPTDMVEFINLEILELIKLQIILSQISLVYRQRI